MKITILLALATLFISCSQQQLDKDVYVNASEINGYWENDQQLIAVWDSIMLHPIRNGSGFFAFTINQDSLIINDKTQKGTLAKLLKLDSDSLIFLYKDSTFRYSRAKPVNPHASFKSINFKAGPCFGECPVFELSIEEDGEVEYEGNHYSESKGKLYGQLPLPLKQELNNFLGYIDFQNYYKHVDNKLFPIPDGPEHDLEIRFRNDKVFVVDNGVFAGKYRVVPRLFYKIVDIVELKNKTP